jgi:hypothetical protein
MPTSKDKEKERPGATAAAADDPTIVTQPPGVAPAAARPRARGEAQPPCGHCKGTEPPRTRRGTWITAAAGPGQPSYQAVCASCGAEGRWAPSREQAIANLAAYPPLNAAALAMKARTRAE